jgi:hypothetical protein
MKFIAYFIFLIIAVFITITIIDYRETYKVEITND